VTTTARTYAALAAIVAGFATIAALLMPAPAAHAGTGVGTDLAILHAANPAGETLTPTQVAQVMTTADRICEAYAALVPQATIRATVAASSGLSEKQAQRFITVAHRELCPNL
jgi:Protein of unknown function (DUF732)